MTLRRVCFVTDELYPLTAGGIGRLVHNFIRESQERGAPVEFHLLLPSYCQLEEAKIQAAFPRKVTVHFAAPREEWSLGFDADGVYPPPGAFTATRWQAESLELLLHLKRLEQQGIHFDVVEFPDYRGWAFCALQEKLLGRALQSTQIAVRLHTTAGIIARFEPHAMDREQLGRFELERKALLDADVVVSPLPAIADFTQRFYGFPPEWRERVRVEFPAVGVSPRAEAPEPTAQPDLLFLTKMQWIKRPDLFIRGVVLFMREHPEYRGRAVLACHAPFADYLASLQKMVPADLRERFVFAGPGPDREALMARGIVVVCSDHESLNLTAYEAAAAGARLVLNGACAAFAPGSPFVEGESCHLFDGTVEGLAGALARAVQKPVGQPVRWSAATPYWESIAVPAPAAPPRRLPRVTVLITNFNLGRYLPETLASVAASSYPEIDVVLVDDASTDPFDHEVLAKLEAQDGPWRPIRVVRNAVNRGLPASRNVGLRHATGDYVLPLDADDCISPTFIELAVRALERHPQYDVVVPTAGYFQTDEALAQRDFCDFACFLGDAPSAALVSNRISCATSLMRRSLFGHFRYNERLTSFEDWDLYLRLVLSGRRFLVTNQVHFHYRRRPGSMIHGLNPRRHFELLSQMYGALPHPLPPSVSLAAFLTHGGMAQSTGAAQQGGSDGEARPLRYGVVDVMNSALKRMPLVHPLLKQLAGGSVEDGRPLRYALADRLNRELKRLPVVQPVLKRALGKARTPNA